MAWVHPLDFEGSLERSDWIAVEGRASASGATVGTVVLSEPGVYVIRPLWRGWGGTMDDPIEMGRGYPNPIRLEVVERGASVGAWAIFLSAGALIAGLAAAQLLRRRQSRERHSYGPSHSQSVHHDAGRCSYRSLRDPI